MNNEAYEDGIPTLDVKRYYQDYLRKLQDSNSSLGVEGKQSKAEQATWVFYCMYILKVMSAKPLIDLPAGPEPPFPGENSN